MKALKGIVQKDISVFLFFSVLTLFFYRNTADAGFTFDFVTLINAFNIEGLIGPVSRYANTGMLPLYHLLLFTLYKLFGLNGFGWYIFSCLTHAFAAYLLFVLVRKILTAIGRQRAFSLALCAALMFLVFPQHTEVLIWRAAIHYQLVAIIFLGCMVLTLHYHQQQNKYLLFAIALLFFAGLFVLEEVLMLPVMLFCLIWLSPQRLIEPANRKAWTLRILLPQVALIALYFVIAKLWIGKSFGHYGGGPTSHINVPMMMTNYLKHLLRIITFHAYTMTEHDVMLHRWMEKPAVAWSSLGVLLAVGLFIAVRYSKLNDVSKVMVLFALFFSLILLPMLLVYRDPIFGPENNRYLYFPALFLLPLLVLFMDSLLAKWRYIPIAAYVGFSMFQLNNATKDWVVANQVKMGLVNDFRWYGSSKIFVLAIPNYAQGIFVFEGGRDFQQAILLYKGKGIFPQTINMLKYNIYSASDSVTVTRSGDSTIHLYNSIPNSWFWYDHVSGGDKETDDYLVTTDGGGGCNITIKHPDRNAAYIYPVGDKWKEIKLDEPMPPNDAH